MEAKALDILKRHRLMAIATLRPDGWPQATLVGFGNDGLLIYFLISRASQKFANISQDDRVSIAIGRDVKSASDIEGLSIAAHASEVTDPDQRDEGYKLLLARHPEWASFGDPDPEKAALMRARCQMITVLDFSQGFGHADEISVGAQNITSMRAARPDDWGFTPSAERRPR